MKRILMKKYIFEHLHKRGIQVRLLFKLIINHFSIIIHFFQTYLWVLNYEEEFKEAYELGVTGVMTDYPTKLKQFLDAHHWY